MIKVFGCTEEALVEAFNSKPSFISKEMMVTSMLSDAQELMAQFRGEEARQMINRAKYIINEF